MSQNQTIPTLELEGPFDDGGTAQGPVTSLLTTDQGTEDTSTETNKEDIPGRDDEDSLLTPLQGERSQSYEGQINAFAALDNGYGTDRLSAVQEYLFTIESLCIAEQGIGYRLEDELNGISRSPTGSKPGVLVEESEWTLADDDNLTGKYRIETQIAEGVTGVSTDIRTNYINQQSNNMVDLGSQSGNGVNDSVLQGEDSNGTNNYALGSIEDFKYTRKVDINASEIIHNQDVPQVGAIESGVQGTVRVSGTLTDSQLITASDITDWVTTINDAFHGQNLTLFEEFTNRPFFGALETSTSEFRDDKPNAVEYDIELAIGQVAF